MTPQSQLVPVGTFEIWIDAGTDLPAFDPVFLAACDQPLEVLVELEASEVYTLGSEPAEALIEVIPAAVVPLFPFSSRAMVHVYAAIAHGPPPPFAGAAMVHVIGAALGSAQGLVGEALILVDAGLATESPGVHDGAALVEVTSLQTGVPTPDQKAEALILVVAAIVHGPPPPTMALAMIDCFADAIGSIPPPHDAAGMVQVGAAIDPESFSHDGAALVEVVGEVINLVGPCACCQTEGGLPVQIRLTIDCPDLPDIHEFEVNLNFGDFNGIHCTYIILEPYTLPGELQVQVDVSSEVLPNVRWNVQWIPTAEAAWTTGWIETSEFLCGPLRFDDDATIERGAEVFAIGVSFA